MKLCWWGMGGGCGTMSLYLYCATPANLDEAMTLYFVDSALKVSNFWCLLQLPVAIEFCSSLCHCTWTGNWVPSFWWMQVRVKGCRNKSLLCWYRLQTMPWSKLIGVALVLFYWSPIQNSSIPWKWIVYGYLCLSECNLCQDGAADIVAFDT